MAGRNKIFIISLLIASSCAYEKQTLSCNFMYKKTDLICFVFELEVYTKLTRINDVSVDALGTVNGLYFLNSMMYYLPDQIFKFFPNITELKIFSDLPQLLEINGREFVHLTQLKSVQIIGQTIRRLESHSFLGATAINKMFLPSNNIEMISKNAFAGLAKCQFLVLNNNRLTKLTKEVFRHMPKLLSLNLKNNRLSSFAENMFGSNVVPIVDLSYNLLLWPPGALIEKLLNEKPPNFLFSVRKNMCPDMKDKIFTLATNRREVPRITKACKDFYHPNKTDWCLRCEHCKLAVTEATLTDFTTEKSTDEFSDDDQQIEDDDANDEQMILNMFGDNSKSRDFMLAELMDENYRLQETCGTAVSLPKHENHENLELQSDEFDDEHDAHSLDMIIEEQTKILAEHLEVLQKIIGYLKKFVTDHGEENFPLLTANPEITTETNEEVTDEWTDQTDALVIITESTSGEPFAVTETTNEDQAVTEGLVIITESTSENTEITTEEIILTTAGLDDKRILHTETEETLSTTESIQTEERTTTLPPNKNQKCHKTNEGSYCSKATNAYGTTETEETDATTNRLHLVVHVIDQ